MLRADLLVLNFRLWWFATPAILKGWVDHVFADGKTYGRGKIYEDGIGRGKRALATIATITTGSGCGSYDGYGYNPSMTSILTPIHHGVFWFNGFRPLPAFVAYRYDKPPHR